MANQEKIDHLNAFIAQVRNVLNALNNRFLERALAVQQMADIISAHRLLVLDAINGGQLRTNLRGLAQMSLVAIRNCLLELDPDVGPFLYDAVDIANVLRIKEITGRRIAVGMFLKAAELYLREQITAIGANNNFVAGGNVAVNALVAIVDLPPAPGPVVIPHVNVVEDDHIAPAEEFLVVVQDDVLGNVVEEDLVEGVANVDLGGEDGDKK